MRSHAKCRVVLFLDFISSFWYDLYTMNKHEDTCKELLEQEGWLVLDRGYPDFCCFKDGKIIFVEVKGENGNKAARLSKEQEIMIEALSSRGLKCYTWSELNGLESISASPLGVRKHHCFKP